jgi:hypothetical protein
VIPSLRDLPQVLAQIRKGGSGALVDAPRSPRPLEEAAEFLALEPHVTGERKRHRVERSHVFWVESRRLLLGEQPVTGDLTVLEPFADVDDVRHGPQPREGSPGLRADPSIKHDAAGGAYDRVSSAYVDSCSAAWFTVSLADGAGFQYTLPANSGTVALDTATVTMVESGTDQTACAGLSVEIDAIAS